MTFYRHKSTGGAYELLGFGKMQSTWWSDTRANFASSVDMREVAVYVRASDGSMWVRPREEFEDGRFEPIVDA